MSAFLNQVRADGELYDGGGGALSPLIPLSTPSAVHAATLQPDDGVLLTGGMTSSAPGGSAMVNARIELLFPLGCGS